MRLKLTDAGIAKLVNLPNTGTNAVVVTQIGLTATAFTPSASLTALPGEMKRVSSFGGMAVGDNTIHVTVRDDSADTYLLRGYGLYLDDGTLFATFGQADAIMQKASASMLLLAADTQFVDVDAKQIQFGSTEFLNPPATTEVQGVVELATNDETVTGTDGQRAVTPRGLRALLDGRFGSGAPTAFAKNLLAIATAAAFRTALEIKGAALRDMGHGNGLDADTLDGRHASEFALAGNFATVGHKHEISDVNGLQGALNAKASLTGATFTGTVAAFGASGFDYIAGGSRIMFREASGNGAACIDAVTVNNSAWAPMRMRGTELLFNDVAVWNAANFNPDAKANLSGATFTGQLVVKDNALRASGWGNRATDGVVYFGGANSYMYKNGAMFSFNNEQGNFNASLESGGTIWTSGNFNPNSKFNTTGGDVTGALSMRGNANGRLRLFDDNNDVPNIELIAGLNNARDRNGIIINQNSGGALALWGRAGNVQLTLGASAGLSTLSGGLNVAGRVDVNDWLAGGALFIGGDRTRQGTQLQWNGVNVGNGGSEYINNRGSGGGGHYFYTRSVATDGLTELASLRNGGHFIVESPAEPNPNAGGHTFAFIARGNFGGGYTMIDGGTYGSTYMAAGNMCWGIGNTNQGILQLMSLNRGGGLSTAGGFDFGSSRKLKTIDGVIPYGLAEVDAMEIAVGSYLPDYNADGRRRLFLVAEQLAELVPEAVDLSGVEFKGERVPSIKIDQLMPLAFRAIQELHAELRSLRTRLGDDVEVVA